MWLQTETGQPLKIRAFSCFHSCYSLNNSICSNEWFYSSPKSQLTICTSSNIPCGALPASTFEQMKSTKVGSGSPMYSMIFLLIQGRIRLSISCCNGTLTKPIINALKLLHFLYNTIFRWHRTTSHLFATLIFTGLLLG